LAIASGICQQVNFDMPIQLTAAGHDIARHRVEFTMSDSIHLFSLSRD
jgi:hypothetical protein